MILGILDSVPSTPKTSRLKQPKKITWDYTNKQDQF